MPCPEVCTARKGTEIWHIATPAEEPFTAPDADIPAKSGGAKSSDGETFNSGTMSHSCDALPSANQSDGEFPITRRNYRLKFDLVKNLASSIALVTEIPLVTRMHQIPPSADSLSHIAFAEGRF